MSVNIPCIGSVLPEDKASGSLPTNEKLLKKQSDSWSPQLCGVVEGLMEIFCRSTREHDVELGSVMCSGAYMFYGSHVRVIGDNCALFHEIKTSGLPINPRASSHRSRDESGSYKQGLLGTYGGQMEIVLPNNWGCILFGVSDYGSNPEHTWFQTENTSGEGASNLVYHSTVDFGLHKASGNLQVAQLGYSEHSEKNGKALIYNGQLPAQLLVATGCILLEVVVH
jgi:hypothetical protein